MVSEGTFTKCMVLFEVQTQRLVIKTLEQDILEVFVER